ncbi:MAG: ATP-dependent Clp protease adaptor ClpS [Bacteroidales bacterium]|jgi:ATP-dependent Clp protease adaptor protein ClpS|nr:ATP-dependent Clp protease adaptor ClpS [Bacteroidales bacterium]
MKEKPIPHKGEVRGTSVHTLILFNDDYNTFEHVIESLVEICGHDPVQAEQCAMIAHHRGSCEIKTGMRKILLSMRTGLLDRNLSCEIK